MVAKIFGIILILAGVGTFIGVISGASSPQDSLYGIFFIGIGILLIYLGNRRQNKNKEIQ